jgi:hypothetical protein
MPLFKPKSTLFWKKPPEATTLHTTILIVDENKTA